MVLFAAACCLCVAQAPVTKCGEGGSGPRVKGVLLLRRGARALGDGAACCVRFCALHRHTLIMSWPIAPADKACRVCRTAARPSQLRGSRQAVGVAFVAMRSLASATMTLSLCQLAGVASWRACLVTDTLVTRGPSGLHGKPALRMPGRRPATQRPPGRGQPPRKARGAGCSAGVARVRGMLDTIKAACLVVTHPHCPLRAKGGSLASQASNHSCTDVTGPKTSAPNRFSHGLRHSQALCTHTEKRKHKLEPINFSFQLQINLLTKKTNMQNFSTRLYGS